MSDELKPDELLDKIDYCPQKGAQSTSVSNNWMKTIGREPGIWKSLLRIWILKNILLILKQPEVVIMLLH